MRAPWLAKSFAEIGRECALYAVDLDGGTEIELHADALVNTGSAFKVAIALEVFCQAVAGALDLDEELIFTPEKFDTAGATAGRAVEMMMRVSDNGATGALLRRVGQPQVLARLSGLGLTRTFIGAQVLDELDGIFARLDGLAQRAGFDSWMQLGAAVRRDGEADMADRLRTIPTDASSIPPEQLGPVSTARELASLWAKIWRDEAGPEPACAGVRAVAGETGRARIETGLAGLAGATYQGKGGSLPGLINNDAGIVALPDGHQYAVAVFTRAKTAFAGESTADAHIGAIAAAAIAELRRQRST